MSQKEKKCEKNLKSYTRDYLLCCFYKNTTYDPYFFEENNNIYRAFFGQIHVKQLAVILCVVKTVLLLAVVIRKIAISASGLTAIASIFIFCAATVSYVLVVVGVQTKRYTFIIPYFTVCVLVILVLVLQFFIDHLETANQKDTLEMRTIGKSVIMMLMIMFEVYTLLVVWRVFIYVNDYQMNAETHHREKVQQLHSVYIEKGEDHMTNHPFKNHLITIREEDEDEDVPHLILT